jgi:hypothetical protein
MVSRASYRTPVRLLLHLIFSLVWCTLRTGLTAHLASVQLVLSIIK